jgi:two-component system response regulator YesN
MLKIYFVEDDATIRESMVRNVKWEQHGYDLVGQAPDGEIAYEQIQKLRPEVIITDLKMPFMDGLELSRLVRKEMPDVKIIVLTGYNDFELVHEALNMGVAKYLLKPITPEGLVKAIVNMRDIVLEEQESRAYQEQYLEEIAKIREMTVQDADNIKIDESSLKMFLKIGSSDDVRVKTRELINKIDSDKLQSFLLSKYFILDTKFVIAKSLEEIGIDNALFHERIDEINIQVSELNSVSEICLYLEELINCAIKLRNETVDKRYDCPVEKAKQYIRENYMDMDISLNMVARFVNLSPTHLSMVFSQESEKTFIEFLTETRIEKAKEFLRCTSMRISDIAYDVGFRDSHYFSFVFKKTVGCSPREFRTNRM